ncbi:MAG: translation initiation factor IF-2 subunit alpha [Candidatus Nezhaarchaeales archaeon]
MVKKRESSLQVGSIVVGTVKEVFDKGAYVTLDEYSGREGYVPLGEISSSWFHNIRDFLKERQKAIFKVINIDKDKGHLYLSLRRVTSAERERKTLEWKRAQKSDVILSFAAKKLGKTLDKAYEEAGWRLEDYFGEIYAGLEEAVKSGVEVLLKAGIPKDWANAIFEVASEHVTIAKVKISGILELKCLKANGVEAIRKALLSALNVANEKGYEVKIYAVGAPRYRVDVYAEEYKKAEAILKEVADTALTLITKEGGEGVFHRMER